MFDNEDDNEEESSVCALLFVFVDENDEVDDESFRSFESLDSCLLDSDLFIFTS